MSTSVTVEAVPSGKVCVGKDFGTGDVQDSGGVGAPLDKRNSSLSALFEAAVLLDPEHEAISSEHASWTYRQLRDLADRVAHALIESGVTAGARVVLLFDTSPEAVAAMLGAVKAGAIAVPLLCSTPKARCLQILQSAEPIALVTDNASAAEALTSAYGGALVVDVGALAPAPQREWPTCDASAPAIMLYTSGSSGRPKGVLHTHRSIVRKILDTHVVLGTMPADRVAMFSTYSVGQGQTVIFSALFHGATVCMFDVKRHGFDRLGQWLTEQRLSIFISSATLFRSITRTPGAGLRSSHLRMVLVGSERVTAADVEACRRTCGRQVTFVVRYSSTETGCIAMHVVDPAEEFGDGVVPVGSPLAGVRVSVVDEAGQPVSPGDVGEIAVYSRDLSLGYWRDPELTASRYQHCGGTGGERRVLTGDLGRFREDGYLEHLGRKDRRVKVRGFRIELDEVERVLSEHPSLARVAAVARADGRGDLRLVTYLELSSCGTATGEDVRRFAAERLPDYMVPSMFLILDALPTSDSGKVLRSQLPDPEVVLATTSMHTPPPESPLARATGAVWSEVLGLESIGLDDSFFMMGGDSLRAAQIASRLSSILGVEVPVCLLLEAATIRALAERLQTRVDGSELVRVPELGQRP